MGFYSSLPKQPFFLCTFFFLRFFVLRRGWKCSYILKSLFPKIVLRNNYFQGCMRPSKGYVLGYLMEHGLGGLFRFHLMDGHCCLNPTMLLWHWIIIDLMHRSLRSISYGLEKSLGLICGFWKIQCKLWGIRYLVIKWRPYLSHWNMFVHSVRNLDFVFSRFKS